MRVRTLAAVLACAAALSAELWLSVAYGLASVAQRTAALVIAALFAISGIVAALLRPRSRIGGALLLMCIAAVLSNLNTAVRLPTDLPWRPVVTLTGTPAFWLQIPLFLFLLLSYPAGRIDRAPERALIRTATVVAVVVSVLLLLTRTPLPLCADWCGPSPVRVVDSVPLYLSIRGAGLLAMLLLGLSAFALLLRRRTPIPSERRRSIVVTAIATACLVLFAGGVVNLVLAYVDGGRLAPWDGPISLAINTTAVAALPVFFVADLVRQRMAFAAFGGLLARARQVEAHELESAIARATGDPLVRVLSRVTDGWRDALGRPAQPTGSFHLVGNRAALIHSPALAEEPDLLHAALVLVDVALVDHEVEPGPVPYAFISYLREDSDTVDRLVDALRTRGVAVWLDRTHLDAGDRWASVVRQAIRNGSYFIACFSGAYARRDRTYMNEELTIAIEELRLRARDRRWFLPVKLEPCTIPALELGAGETLDALHHVDVSDGWETAVERLVRAVSR